MKTFHILASALATAALFGSAPAYATPPAGLGVVGVSSGNFGTLSINTAGDKTGQWGLILKTLDNTDIGVDQVSLDPNGHTGWHAHPSPVFITVTDGTLTWYDGANPLCTPHTYHAGDSFIEGTYKVHNAVNPSGSASVTFIAVTIKPVGFVGPAFVLDRPEPNNCKF